MKQSRYVIVGVLVASMAVLGWSKSAVRPVGDADAVAQAASADAAVPVDSAEAAVASGLDLHAVQSQEEIAEAERSASRESASEVPQARATGSAQRAPQTVASSGRGGRGGGSQSRRRGGFRNVNRYPGRIPTPEEWVAPEGPVRIALQAGHWKASEAPPELNGLKDNGTTGGGKAEWEVNLAIAQSTAALLKTKGYEVDILPAVVPPGYRAHLFIAIHADGALDTRASGYRVAAPRQDATGRASQMVTLLEESYGKTTGLRKLPDVTRRMENYYAFNFRRYEHALHPMTIAVIIETGFLTSASDRRLIVNDPDKVARGIVDAVVAFPVTPAPLPADSAGVKGG